MNIRMVFLFIVLATTFVSAPAHAIRQIMTCQSTITSVNGGESWAAVETCWVSGYEGDGSWATWGDREPPRYIRDHSYYYLGGTAISREEAVRMCKDTVKNNARDCGRGAALGTGLFAWKCATLGNIWAIGACEIAVALGSYEAFNYCDDMEDSGNSVCDSI